MFDIGNFFKKIIKPDQKELLAETTTSKDAAKERLHVVLMQDRANVSADFLELMKQEIIDVIKKYIVIDEEQIDVRLTNQENEDGTTGAPSLYANIPILNIRNDIKGGLLEQNSQNEVSNESKTEETDSSENYEEDDDDVTFDDLLKAAEEEEKRKKDALGSSEEATAELDIETEVITVESKSEDGDNTTDVKDSDENVELLKDIESIEDNGNVDSENTKEVKEEKEKKVAGKKTSKSGSKSGAKKKSSKSSSGKKRTLKR